MSEPWIVSRREADQKLIEVLLEYGFAIVPEALGRMAHRSLREELEPHFEQAEFCQGLFYGHHTKRFGRVLSRSEQAQALALNKLALDPARSVLGPDCQEIQLNLTQAIEIWPQSYAQVPHRDRDIWLGAKHQGELMLNAMWAIDDFTRENGATLIWPGSHLAPDLAVPEDDGICAAMPRGSLCLFLGSTIHAGGANWSNQRRRGLVFSYCLGWLKPCENPWLSYPPHVASGFSPELRRLIGYRQDAPSLNNVDGRCPSELFQAGGASKAFADRLTSEQVAQIELFNEMQLPTRPKAA